MRATGNGHYYGRFPLTPEPGTMPPLQARLVAVTLADRTGSALDTAGRPDNVSRRRRLHMAASATRQHAPLRHQQGISRPPAPARYTAAAGMASMAGPGLPPFPSAPGSPTSTPPLPCGDLEVGGEYRVSLAGRPRG
ncbi:hypothetical protein [Streptomyces sp. CA-132043]|uniref:hypothetical protein n=1 Tax=Streptomyces sp. CA-132043 TaxID=3240048 RepID=UPI003D8D9FB6